MLDTPCKKKKKNGHNRKEVRKTWKNTPNTTKNGSKKNRSNKRSVGCWTTYVIKHNK